MAVVAQTSPDQADPGVNYALRMTEALDAISSAQTLEPTHHASPAEEPTRLRTTAAAPRARAHKKTDAEPPRPNHAGFGAPNISRPVPAQRANWFKRLENLPPIRLPIGPPIPWRFGVPALVLLVAATLFFARSGSQAGTQVSRLPTQQAYPVEQQAPLFADTQPTPAPSPIGVSDPAGSGFDVVDVGIKLIAVLALAYGSLLLLKRTGMGGASVMKTGGKLAGFQVVASLTLAPNRTVHLLKVPGGKTVVVGATPNQINLIADLGEIADEAESEAAGSFFDILKGKISV